MRGNVVDLAVAVVIGAAFGTVVSSLVADLLTPLIGAIIGEPDFGALTFTINGSVFTYGNFINALISFLSVAAAVYFFVVAPLNKLKDLQNGESADRSIIVVSDWMAKKMYDLGYLQNLDKDAIPTVNENLLDSLKSPSIGPDRSYTVPWQSGLTGLVVNTKEAPDIDSINDIFDPKYKGKVTILTELRDTVPIILQGEGIAPEDASTQDWLDAIEMLGEAVKSGQIRKPDRQQLHRRPRPWRRGRGDRLVRRCDPAPVRQPRHQLRQADGRMSALVGQHGDPGRRAEPRRGVRIHEHLRPRTGSRRSRTPGSSCSAAAADRRSVAEHTGEIRSPGGRS